MTVQHTEYITIENVDDWRCICGNTADQQGFFTVNEAGDQVEPTPQDWTTNEYICARCGRIINMDTGEVTRRKDPNAIKWLIPESTRQRDEAVDHT